MAYKFSPVVRADAHLTGPLRNATVSVWFQSKAEIQTLIEALEELKDTEGDDFDHVHLQHHAMGDTVEPISMAEVMFYRPGRQPTELDQDLVQQYTYELREVRQKPA